jgi:hypothetical protein
MPQTCADFADRVEVLDVIRKEEPRIARKLMLTLLPGDHETLNPSSKPRWREIPPELPDQSNTHALIREAEEIAERLLADIGGDAAQWKSLIEAFAQLPPKHLQRARAGLLTRIKSFDADARKSLWGTVRELLHRHRAMSDAVWALPEEALAPLDEIYAALTPSDRVEQVAWLFNDQSAQLPEKLDGGWEAYEPEAEIRRRGVVEETLGKRRV